MGHSPQTRPSLLVRLRNRGDHQAWEQFVELYAPLIYGMARRKGLQDADAADVTQDVLRAVVKAGERLEYDPARGSFRGWLFTIAQNKLRDFANRRWRAAAKGGTDSLRVLEELPDSDEPDAEWDREYQQRLFSWATERVRHTFESKTWQAFWLTAVEGQGPKQVAELLALSVGAVYIAKSRVLAKIRSEIESIESEDR